MATINGLTAAAMRAIRDGAIVGASVDISGHLILEKFDGSFLDTGSVVGPVGPMGPAGPVPEAPSDNIFYVRRNGAWVAVPAPPVGEAPADGKYYSRRNGAWSVSDAILGSSVLVSSVALFESTVSSAYGDLATVGPVVNATIGASGKALVMVSADIYNDTTVAPTFMNYAISGVTTVVPQDAAALRTQSDEISASRLSLVSGLNPGVNTFTSKYKCLGGTGYFGFRSLTVIPL